ncbi:hypothetical protein CMI47_01905, partial [Candidatus Pacearchaeota archaeon]|nr:hypothetical protein [Candidatus Pacearchaeota archaeon]
GWGNNLLGGVAADIALSPSFKPSVNTVEWDGTGVASSVSTPGMPGVSIQQIKGVSAKTGTDTARLQVDVKEWDSDDTAINVTDHFPDVNVMEWEGDTGAVKTSASTGLPEVDVDSINDSSSAANNLQDFMDEGYDNINNAVENVNLIRPDGIQEDSFQADAISSRVFDDDAITADVIADNAIDEGAIQVDSVTYEEISSSAVAEIVEGIWNADVRSPIDDSGTYNGSSYSGADIGSMGHAMLAQYITQHTVHNSADGFTPYHNCAHDDSDGKRFYSSSLASDSLSGEQMPGYIDRTAILTRSIFGATPEDYEQYLVRIISVETDGHGQHFVIQMVDEDESSIPGGIVQSTDALIVKAETDPTMHEVAHEVWEESVFDHETADTFGMFSRIMTGLTQFNHRITDSLYDDSGRLLSCRLVVYPSSEDAKNETNALTTVEVTSTYDEKQNMETFLAKEE